MFWCESAQSIVDPLQFFTQETYISMHVGSTAAQILGLGCPKSWGKMAQMLRVVNLAKYKKMSILGERTVGQIIGSRGLNSNMNVHYIILLLKV